MDILHFIYLFVVLTSAAHILYICLLVDGQFGSFYFGFYEFVDICVQVFFFVCVCVQVLCMCVFVKLLQSCPTLCDPMDCSLSDPLSMGFSRQEYWSWLPWPPLGDLPKPGIEPLSLTLAVMAGGLFTTSTTGEAPQVLYTHMF